jgi:hypothetical protein
VITELELSDCLMTYRYGPNFKHLGSVAEPEPQGAKIFAGAGICKF